MTRSIWFTSDTHFGHANIIKYCDRPFFSIEEMDEALVERWNTSVRSDDLVYHLGDFAVTPLYAKKIRPRLNGTIRLVIGNHDDPLKLAGLFQRMYLFCIFRDEGFIASHMPLARHLCRAPACVHGHIHNNPADLALAEPHQLNLSVEMTDYRPVALEDLRVLVAAKMEAAA